jgi:hypothetical protein
MLPSSLPTTGAESLVMTRAAVLGALLGKADFDGAGFEELIGEVAQFAREWVAARQGKSRGV